MSYHLAPGDYGSGSASQVAAQTEKEPTFWEKVGNWFNDLGERFYQNQTQSTNDYMRGAYNVQQLAQGNADPINQSLADAANSQVPDVSLDVTGYDQAEWEFQKQRELLEEQRAYNSAEAEKLRQWQEHMSNTAYQRATQDLEKAGLNKWLAVTGGGNGASASTPSGASASSSAGDASAPNATIYKALLQFISSMTNSALKGMSIIGHMS